MAGTRYTARDLLAERPGLDHVAGLLAAGVWFVAFRRVEVSNVPEFLLGLATVSALVLAAATFVCTLTYQSQSDRIEEVRVLYGAELRRNWVSIFRLMFLTSTAPLVALLLVGQVGPLVPLVATWCAGMLVAKASRTVYWLDKILFTQNVDDRRPRAVEGPTSLSV